MTAALAMRGVDVTVATTDADGPGRLPVPIGVPVDEAGVAYHYFRRTGRGRYNFSIPLARWIDANVGRFDVVHVHGLWDWASVVGCRGAWRHGVPYVVRPAGMLDPWALSIKRWKKQPYFRMIEQPQLRRAFAIHTTATFEGDAVASLGFADRTRVIPLGVSAPDWVRAPRQARSRGPVRVVFLSRLHPEKGLLLLLDAMTAAVAQGLDLRLDVVGAGEPDYVAEARARAAVLGDRVRFLGHLDGDTKWQLLVGGDLFVLPSSHENFGIAVAEALVAGVPVIVSDQVAIAPEIDAAGAGLVVPRDGASLTAALVELASHPSRREVMGHRARELATGTFSWDACAQRLETLYAESAGVRGRSANVQTAVRAVGALAQ
jgi:glycosyltransferase involved in cell wall biosynthesis